MIKLTEHYPGSSSTAPYSLILNPDSWRKTALSRNALMQNNSEHIRVHDCDNPRCPGVCIQTNIGMMNINSHNTNTSRWNNCGNCNHTTQCRSFLLLINCCPTNWSHLSDSVPEITDPASIDEGSLSLESHGRHLLTYTIAHAIIWIPFFSKFRSRNPYHFPFPYVSASHTLRGTTHFGLLNGLLLSNNLHINCINQKSHSI